MGTKGRILYNDCVEGQGAQMPCVPSIATSKPVTLLSPAPLSKPSRNRVQRSGANNATLVFGFTAGNVCHQAVCIHCLSFRQDMTPRCFRHAANDCEKEMRHGCPSPPSLACLHMDFRAQREGERGNNPPLSTATPILAAISIEGRRRDSHASSETDTP